MIDLKELQIPDKELLCWIKLSKSNEKASYRLVNFSSCKDLMKNMDLTNGQYPIFIKKPSSQLNNDWQKAIKIGDHLYLYTEDLKKELDSKNKSLSAKLRNLGFGIYKYYSADNTVDLMGYFETEILDKDDYQVGIHIHITLDPRITNNLDTEYIFEEGMVEFSRGDNISSQEIGDKNKLENDLKSLLDSYKGKKLSQQDIIKLVTSIVNIKNKGLQKYNDIEIFENLSLKELFEVAYKD